MMSSGKQIIWHTVHRSTSETPVVRVWQVAFFSTWPQYLVSYILFLQSYLNTPPTKKQHFYFLLESREACDYSGSYCVTSETGSQTVIQLPPGSFGILMLRHQPPCCGDS